MSTSATTAKPARRPLIQVLSSTDEPNDLDLTTPAAADHSPASATPATAAALADMESTDDDDQGELIESVLALLAGILGLGQQRRTPEEEALIKSLVAPLQVIAFRRPPYHGSSGEPEAADGSEGGEGVSAEDTISQAASDVALTILSRSYNLSHPAGTKSSQLPSTAAALTEETATRTTAEPFAQVLQRMCNAEYLFSDSPAMRGYGTRILLQHVRHRSALNSKVCHFVINYTKVKNYFSDAKLCLLCRRAS